MEGGGNNKLIDTTYCSFFSGDLSVFFGVYSSYSLFQYRRGGGKIAC